MSENLPELDGVVEVGPIIGEGTFSTVYRGLLLPKYAVDGGHSKLAIKCITPVVEPQMLENELNCLTLLKGNNNVVPLLFAMRHKGSLCLVMPFYEYEKFNRLIRRFNCSHARDYMHQLFIAMEHIHHHQIIHRDVKPNNFLYSIKTKRCALVDFGLAQTVAHFNKSTPRKSETDLRVPLEDLTVSNANSRVSLCDKPKKRKSEEIIKKTRCSCQSHARVCRDCIGTPAISAARAGTAGYRPPEVLLKCTEQTTAVDMWACGVIFMSILSGKSNFFNAPDDLKNLVQLVTLFGKEAVCNAATAMGKNLIIEMPANENPATLKELCERLRATTKRGLKVSRRETVAFPDSAYNLLERLLALKASDRITATEALNHPFITDCG